MDDLRMDFGTSTFSTNIGLAFVLNERNIHGGSTLSLDQMSSLGTIPGGRRGRTGSVSDVASICSLTPSVIHSPTDLGKSFSPTGTPLNSPDGSRSASPVRSDANPGFVLGFFASLRTALYGEQQKEVMTLTKKHKKSKKKLGILKKVQEVGPERFLSPAPLTEEEGSEVEEPITNLNQDWDELEDIRPGTLTISRGIKSTKAEKDLFGELRPPDPRGESQSGRGPGRIVSPGDKRPGFPSAFGVPGKTGTGALKRSDLGSVPTTSGASLINNAERLKSKPSEDNSFIGSLASMFFGRKGGLL